MCRDNKNFFRGYCYECFSKLVWRYFCTECNKKYEYAQAQCKCGNKYFIIGQDTFGFRI